MANWLSRHRIAVTRSVMLLGGASIALQGWLAFRSGTITYRNAYYQPVIPLFAVGAGVTLLVVSGMTKHLFAKQCLEQDGRVRYFSSASICTRPVR